MPFNLLDGATAFVDANILYYHFVQAPPLSDSCSDLLERIAHGEIAGSTSVHILAEAVHKIMIAEAASKFQLSRTGLVNWLQHNRQRIGELANFRQAADEISRLGLQILPMDALAIKEAAELSAKFGLLTNDALLVALMFRYGIHNLATNDNDFDAIPNLRVWKPR